MTYALIKAAHLISLFLWVGGMVAASVALRYPETGSLNPLRMYDRRVTSPAMVLAWAFGIALAVQGGWFEQPWLALKIGLVLILSGLHGVLAGKLRRATAGTGQPVALRAPLLLVGFVTLALIVLVVTIKP